MTTLELQRRLTSLGFSPGLLDGKFGRQTKAAVEAFQRAYGLVVDGIPGRQTWAALTAATTPAAPGQPEPDKSAMNEAPPPGALVVDSLPVHTKPVELLPTSRPISEIIVHCTATPEGRDYTVADVRSWHKARGWSDIGYHYLVSRDGSIHIGRPVGQVGAHVSGRNAGTIGVAYVGGVTADGRTAKDTRTPEQRAALLWLVRALAGVHRGIRTVSGHNQHTTAKACPSFDVRADALGRAFS